MQSVSIDLLGICITLAAAFTILLFSRIYKRVNTVNGHDIKHKTYYGNRLKMMHVNFVQEYNIT